MLNRAHAVASLTIMVLATAASRADMVSFNSPLAIPMVLAGDGRNYSGDATVMLPKFNTMGGTRTLTQVTLQVSGFAAGSAYAENNEAAAGTCGVGFPILFTGTGPGPTQSDAAITAANSMMATLAASDGTPNSGPDYQFLGNFNDPAAESEQIATDAAFNSYSGAGNFSVLVSGSGTINTRGTLTDVTLSNVNIRLNGAVVVTYQFTVAPAPGGAALALGAALLAARRRR